MAVHIALPDLARLPGLVAGAGFRDPDVASANAPELLCRERAKPGYQPSPIALGINTDAYPPIEPTLQLTRRFIQVLADARHPCSLITKNALVTRDLDLLTPRARDNLVRVHFSLTTG